MELGSQFLFFFSSLGVFNGFLMGIYFLFLAKPKRIQNLFFGLLLVMLTIRIGKSVLYFFDNDLSKTILQIGLSACVFIGPLLFFYLRSVLYQQKKVGKQAIIQMGTLLVLTVVVGIMFPYAQRPDLWNPEIVQVIYAIWLGYLIAGGYVIRGLFMKLFAPSQALSTTEQWLVIVFATNALVCLMFHHQGRYTAVCQEENQS